MENLYKVKLNDLVSRYSKLKEERDKTVSNQEKEVLQNQMNELLPEIVAAYADYYLFEFKDKGHFMMNGQAYKLKHIPVNIKMKIAGSTSRIKNEEDKASEIAMMLIENGIEPKPKDDLSLLQLQILAQMVQKYSIIDDSFLQEFSV